MVFVYYSFRLDRETIMELKELFKAMKRLDQLKKESDMDSVRHIEKSRTQQEEDSDEKDCPLSTTDWVMFLSNEIDRTERDQPPIMTALIAAILAIMGVGVTVAVMRIPESLYYHKLMFLFIISIIISIIVFFLDSFIRYFTVV